MNWATLLKSVKPDLQGDKWDRAKPDEITSNSVKLHAGIYAMQEGFKYRL